MSSISQNDKSGFTHTTYKNMEERMTNMLLHEYWEYIIKQINDDTSLLRKYLDTDDAKNLTKNGHIKCLALSLYNNSTDIQNSKTFNNGIGL